LSTKVHYKNITVAINTYILRREVNCVTDIFHIQQTSSYEIHPRYFIMSLAVLGLRPYIKKLQSWSWNQYHVSWDLEKNCWHCKLCTEFSVNSKRLFRRLYATKPDNKSHCLIIHGFRKWIIQYVSYMLQPLIGMLFPILVCNNHWVLKRLRITQISLIEHYTGNLIIYMMTCDSNNMENKGNNGTEIKKQWMRSTNLRTIIIQWDPSAKTSQF
jgi:hypothetical protein